PSPVDAAARTAPSTARTAPSKWLREPVIWCAALLGAASLGLEVLALRLLVTVTGASIYAFAIVLTVFLAGIGFGSRQLSQWRSQRVAEIDVLFYCALSAPLLALAGLWSLRFQLAEGDLFGSLSNRVPMGASLVRLWLSHVLLASLALLLPALAFGMALPAAAGALATRHARDAREVWLGRLYAANTFGALTGSLLAAFVLLPHVGPRIAMACVLALASIAALCVAFRRSGVWVLGTAAAAVVATQVLAPADERAGLTVRVHAFDAHTTVAVEELRTSSGELVRTLRVNGKPEASSGAVDQRLQLLLGHVPGLLHGDVRSALVIGLGSGMTAGSLLDLPTLRALTIFEISPAIERAAREFGPWNNTVLDDPRTKLRFGDGRHMLATSTERFDLITADPVHPWTRGSSDLYTLEHFETIAAHLASGGIASQWLPLYELSTGDLQTVAATWNAAFPHTAAYLSAYDLILVGARDPGVLERDLAGRSIAGQIAKNLARIGIGSPLELAALQVAGRAALEAFAQDAAPMRDDRPVLEFRAPLSYLAGYSVDVLAWAIRDEYVEDLSTEVRPAARAFRAAVRRFLERAPHDPGAAAGALGHELIRASGFESR
ncbi:MAG: spermidine synthase, partial [Planctomycetota bacterium]